MVFYRGLGRVLTTLIFRAVFSPTLLQLLHSLACTKERMGDDGTVL